MGQPAIANQLLLDRKYKILGAVISFCRGGLELSIEPLHSQISPLFSSQGGIKSFLGYRTCPYPIFTPTDEKLHLLLSSSLIDHTETTIFLSSLNRFLTAQVFPRKLVVASADTIRGSKLISRDFRGRANRDEQEYHQSWRR